MITSQARREAQAKTKLRQERIGAAQPSRGLDFPGNLARRPCGLMKTLQRIPVAAVRLVGCAQLLPVNVCTRAPLATDALRKAFGQPFATDNRPGANGIIDTDAAANAPAIVNAVNKAKSVSSFRSSTQDAGQFICVRQHGQRPESFSRTVVPAVFSCIRSKLEQSLRPMPASTACPMTSMVAWPTGTAQS